MALTLFDVVATHPEIANSTNFLLLSQALQPHEHMRMATAMALDSADILEAFGRNLGRALRQGFGAAVAQDILQLLMDTAFQALQETHPPRSEPDR